MSTLCLVSKSRRGSIQLIYGLSGTCLRKSTAEASLGFSRICMLMSARQCGASTHTICQESLMSKKPTILRRYFRDLSQPNGIHHRILLKDTRVTDRRVNPKVQRNRFAPAWTRVPWLSRHGLLVKQLAHDMQFLQNPSAEILEQAQS